MSGNLPISNALLDIVVSLLAKTSGLNKINFAQIASAPHAFYGFNDVISGRGLAVFMGDRKMFSQPFPI